MMMRRRGVARGVMRTAATTAVVVGTARAVGGAMDSHAANKQAGQQAEVDAQQAAYDQQAQMQQQQYEMQQMQAQMQQMQQAAQPAPVAAAAAVSTAAGGLSSDDMSKLKQLADLHTAGALSDAEFDAAKQKILG
jgi:type VI protein secretion system component VasK